jgi:hypothetical protein
MKCGIYQILCQNGHRYVGSSTDITKRWTVHKCFLRQGKHHSQALQQAWVKYGEDRLYFRGYPAMLPGRPVRHRPGVVPSPEPQPESQLWLHASTASSTHPGGIMINDSDTQRKMEIEDMVNALKKLGNDATLEEKARVMDEARKRRQAPISYLLGILCVLLFAGCYPYP